MDQNHVYDSEKRGPRIIEHKGKNIFWFDLSDGKPEDGIIGSEKFTELLKTTPPNSALLLTDMTNLRFNSEATEHFKKFTVENKPHIKKSVILGVDGLKRIIMSAAIKLSGRTNLKTMDDKEEAMDWLIAE